MKKIWLKTILRDLNDIRKKTQNGCILVYTLQDTVPAPRASCGDGKLFNIGSNN